MSGPDYHGWTHANGIDPIPDVIFTGSRYAVDVLSDSPRLYWQMQDDYLPSGGAGAACKDSSGNAQHADQEDFFLHRQPGGLLTPLDRSFGKWHSTTPQGVARNSRVSSATDNFTIEFLMFAGAGSTDVAVVQQGPSGTDGWDIQIRSTGKLRYRATGVGNGADSTATLTAGGWYHVVVLRDSGTWKYYINGNLDTASAGTDTPGTPSTFFYVLLGDWCERISHVAYYETVLSGARITSHFQKIRQ